jgi:hypothetical protein
MGVDFGDLDGDGTLDVFVTNFSHDTNTAYRNLASGVFADATVEMNLRMASWFNLGWATRFVDLDNDGDQDLFVANGHVYPEAHQADPNTAYAQRNQIFWNQGGGKFDEGEFPEEDAMAEVSASRGAAFGDMDEDGDTDVAVVNIDELPSLLRNEPRGQWLGLRSSGDSTARSGAPASFTSGPLRQMKKSTHWELPRATRVPSQVTETARRGSIAGPAGAKSVAELASGSTISSSSRFPEE